MSWRYYSYVPSKPIKVEGGIKAKSKRGDIGETWWSKRWIHTLESFGWSNRLERGRRYARSGQVLEFKLNSGTIKAKVQGSVRRPYTVTIQIEVFDAIEWKKIVNLMAEKALFAAKLLAGEMPQNIEEIFNSAGTPLFPKSKKDIKTYCSCPDYANPCKHVAAVHYILAEEFDRDPFMLFEIRGRAKQEIIELLRNKRSRYSAKEQDLPKVNFPMHETENIHPLENFWMGTNLDPFPVNISLPKISAGIIKRIGPPDFWNQKEDFISLMSKYYDEISKNAIENAFGENNDIIDNTLIKNNQEAQIDEHEEILRDLFKNDTKKNPIWRGKETKGYLEWKQKRTDKK